MVGYPPSSYEHLLNRPALSAPAPSRALAARKRRELNSAALRAGGRNRTATPAAPLSTGGKPQKTTGGGLVGVRQLAPSEKGTGFGKTAAQFQTLKHAQQRAGHRYQILKRADGSTLHVYGKDVPEDLRRVVLPAARRKARPRPTATFTPQVPGA